MKKLLIAVVLLWLPTAPAGAASGHPDMEMLCRTYHELMVSKATSKVPATVSLLAYGKSVCTNFSAIEAANAAPRHGMWFGKIMQELRDAP